MSNSTAILVNRVNRLPPFIRNKLLTFGVGRVAKVVDSSGIQIRHLSEERTELYLPNRPKVRNHIGGVAAAMAILHAETASALVLIMNVSDDCVPVLKSVNFDFNKRITGSLIARASLTESERKMVNGTKKGELVIKTHLTDDTGREPVEGEFTWAWIPKNR